MNAKWMAGIGVARLAGATHTPSRARGNAPLPAPVSARGPRRSEPGAVWFAETLAAWNRTRTQIRLWRQRARGRRELAGMSEMQLRDIGVGSAEARTEAAKPFWEA